MVSFRQKKGGLEPVPEEERVAKDARPIVGSSATLSNVGPNRLDAVADEAYD